MPTSIVSMLALLFLAFGIILIVEGLAVAGVVLLVLSVLAFVLWWRMWEKKT